MFLIDDYKRMTWVSFLKLKSEEFDKFKALKSLVENENDLKIKFSRSYNGGDFKTDDFEEFCENHRIEKQYSAARTPQQNGAVERKNKHVQEIVSTMLNESKVSDRFWREEVYTVVYILYRGQIRVSCDKTPYELWKGRPTFVKHFKIFGIKCCIK